VRKAKNKVQIYNDVTIIYSTGVSIKTHSNHCHKIILANETINVGHDKKTLSAYGTIVHSDTSHKVKSYDGELISIFINPQSPLGSAIDHLFKRSRVLKIDSQTAYGMYSFLNNNEENHITESDIQKRIAQLILNTEVLPSRSAIDSRIESVTDTILYSNKKIKFKDLLKLAGLSESRLIHLFKKETGITIRKFILWSRTQKAISDMMAGSSIKQAAHAAGFTDSAHFNRTFVSMFGFPPSQLTK
jgi:AraC-like DNA-binding protein